MKVGHIPYFLRSSFSGIWDPISTLTSSAIRKNAGCRDDCLLDAQQVLEVKKSVYCVVTGVANPPLANRPHDY